MRLLGLVKEVHRQLAKVPESAVIKSKDARRALRKLCMVVKRAGRLMANYTGQGFVVRFLHSGSDKGAFECLERDILAGMQVRSCFSCVLSAGLSGNSGWGTHSTQAHVGCCKASDTTHACASPTVNSFATCVHAVLQSCTK